MTYLEDLTIRLAQGVARLSEPVRARHAEYLKAAQRTSDASIRQLLNDLADEERHHEVRAEQLEAEKVPESTRHEEEEASRRLFLLQVVQPGLAGLMDGSVSTLAPLFAAAFSAAQMAHTYGASYAHW